MKTFILFSTRRIMIQLFTKITYFGSRMSALSKKELINKVESFLKSSFDLQQIYKIVLTQNQ